jgi:predicted acyltransferase
MTTSGTTSETPVDTLPRVDRAGATDTANLENVAIVQPAPLVEPTPSPPKAKRLASVDALRGFDMFWIMGGAEAILALIALFISPVPEAIARQFDHVEWEGFVAWDLIMPLFLFVSGAALPFSMSKWHSGKGGRRGFYLRLARRIALLWILGMAIQGNLFDWDLDKLKLYSNTLQAIAAGYLVSTIFLLTMSIRAQIIATAALLLGFWGIMMLVPIPGQGAGHLEPLTNFAHYFEGVVFGRFRDTWTYTWALSSMGFAATVMQGVFAGHVLRTMWSDRKKTLVLLALAIGSLAAGWIWGLWFPIIKHIWTSSMVLWSGGWCYLLLVAFFWVIDVKGYRKWAFPLVVVGMNAIAVYVATHLFDFRAMSDVFVGNLEQHSPSVAEFLGAFGALLIPWLILYYMYRKNTFIRL